MAGSRKAALLLRSGYSARSLQRAIVDVLKMSVKRRVFQLAKYPKMTFAV
jgi:hypothetical protein